MQLIENKNLNAYKQIIDSNPVLSCDEEKKLFKLIDTVKVGRKHQEAKDKLFNSNLRIVLKLSRNCHSKNSYVPFEDIVSVGCEALANAINGFDRKLNFKFSGYAYRCIFDQLYKYIGTLSAITTPSAVLYNAYKYNEVKDLQDKEILKKLNISSKTLSNLKMISGKFNSVSLDQEDVDGNCLYYHIKGDTNTPYHNVEQKDNKEVLKRVIDELSPIKKDIILCRYLDGDKKNLFKLGKKYKLSGERIRQIEVEALKELKRKLKRKFDVK